MAHSTPNSRTPTIAEISSTIEQLFANRAKLTTTEGILPPDTIRDVDAEAAKSKLQPGQIEDPTLQTEPTKKLVSLEASTGFIASFAADMMKPYARMLKTPRLRKSPSTFIPSSIQMYHLVHLMNDTLCESTAFGAICPNYHPYLTRLYCGIVFWIQSMRAANYSGCLALNKKEFIAAFLAEFPPESLPIPGPVLPVFKALCASQPEFPEYGLVTPIVPSSCGPNNRSRLIKDDPISLLLPNVPGIFALISDLITEGETNANFPAKYDHLPVKDDACTFGFANIAAQATRTTPHKRSLCSPGLEYPNEADEETNFRFVDNSSNFNFPELVADEDLRFPGTFLSLSKRTDWFHQLISVMADVCHAFNSSGTLYDCPAYGFNANQFITTYQAATHTLPTRIADPAARTTPTFTVSSSVRSSISVPFGQACVAQVNADFPNTHYIHPACIRSGDYWNITPIQTSRSSAKSYEKLRPMVRAMFKSDKI